MLDPIGSIAEWIFPCNLGRQSGYRHIALQTEVLVAFWVSCIHFKKFEIIFCLTIALQGCKKFPSFIRFDQSHDWHLICSKGGESQSFWVGH